ncbi:hypothetical protein [Modicisalibacter luteus]|uniref:Uncharacterized protein n=1 Tax=Modicisalibacter luteus TaxID=453962 RepID=A0ABV7M8M7_9GAMM|nr:hypothetical protein [Halomonas lutea]GHB15578.1 hypothetical protein GCM10007159_42360 [Halomonas lutea]
MLNWISQHSQALGVVTNFGTLIIWLVYAQLLYFGFRRQRRPQVIINRGRKRDVDALCIISNMSAEAIFVEYIIVELKTSRGTVTMDVTDFNQKANQGDDPDSVVGQELGKVSDYTREGPLASGDFMHIGTFSDLVHRLAGEAGIEMQGYRPKSDLCLQSLTIRLIGIYGSEDRPIGAERRFELKHEGGEEKYTLVPSAWKTQRLSSLRQRRRLRKDMEAMNETNYVASSSIQREG